MNVIENSIVNDKKFVYSPSSGIKDIITNSSENESLNYLASILVEAFLDEKEYERNK